VRDGNVGRRPIVSARGGGAVAPAHADETAAAARHGSRSHGPRGSTDQRTIGGNISGVRSRSPPRTLASLLATALTVAIAAGGCSSESRGVGRPQATTTSAPVRVRPPCPAVSFLNGDCGALPTTPTQPSVSVAATAPVRVPSCVQYVDGEPDFGIAWQGPCVRAMGPAVTLPNPDPYIPEVNPPPGTPVFPCPMMSPADQETWCISPPA